jgi:hypothetical protein
MTSFLEWLIHQMLNYAEKLQFSLGCLAKESFDLSAVGAVGVFWDVYGVDDQHHQRRLVLLVFLLGH